MERKSIPLELKDVDTSKRTALIAHAVYTNIDLTKDVSTKGMFTKSWNESKGKIDFLFNHIEGDVVGPVLRVFEDEQKAYTEVKFGAWTLGNDVLEMADAGVLKGASFGYETVQKEFKTMNNQRVRVLKEVKHLETSLLTKLPANPLAGIVTFQKMVEEKQLNDAEKQLLSMIAKNDQDTLERMIALCANMQPNDDLYNWICWNISRRADMMGSIRNQLYYNEQQAIGLKQHIEALDKFVKTAKASDECIKAIACEAEELKAIISQYDTGTTGQINQPEPSIGNDGDLYKQLLLLNAKLSLQ